MSDVESNTIAISALQHAVYCMRQAALIHVEQQWAENQLTAEGHILHKAADIPFSRKVRGIRRVSAMHLESHQYKIHGVADLVDFIPQKDGPPLPVPIEIKRGKPKRHRADEVQLCAQILCLEEMYQMALPEGVLYYATPKRRTVVPIDDTLRKLTINTISEFRTILKAGKTPLVKYSSRKCPNCSLIELCRPKAYGQSVIDWRTDVLKHYLEEDQS